MKTFLTVALLLAAAFGSWTWSASWAAGGAGSALSLQAHLLHPGQLPSGGSPVTLAQIITGCETTALGGRSYEALPPLLVSGPQVTPSMSEISAVFSRPGVAPSPVLHSVTPVPAPLLPACSFLSVPLPHLADLIPGVSPSNDAQ